MTAFSPEQWPADWPWSPDADPVRADRAMVATTDRLATDVGIGVLSRGGNAVDAAVAVSFALAVVNPEAGNVGGGGFMLVREPDGRCQALDYRSTAPAAASPDMFLAPGVEPERSQVGLLAAAVPGSVRGCWEAHRRLGRLPWAELLEPAVRLARGFEVTDRFTRSFEPHIVEGLGRFPDSARIFLPDGGPPKIGDTFRQTDLAVTLERIRDGGADGFYRGETARLVAGAMAGGGGLITREDLEGYRAVWREPVRVGYRGHTLVTMPLSSSGGIALASIAGMLSDVSLGELPWHGPRHVHLLAEVWRRAFADRNHYLADPDLVDVPAGVLASREYAAWRAGGVTAHRATPSAAVGPGVEAYRRGGAPDAPAAATRGGRAEPSSTTHVSIVDADGAAVSLTTTVNTWYGSKAVVPGTGVLMNNEMDDFTTRPGQPNHFGLVQGEANAVEAGKRPLSAMTPTLVLDPGGDLALVVGTPGGSTIITTVFQVVSNLLDHGMSVAAAVAAPRVHHQHLPDRIYFEEAGLPPEVVAALEGMGHETEERQEPSGDVMAVGVRPGGGLEGVADPRRGGVAGGL